MRRLSVVLLASLFAMYASTALAVDFANGLYWGFNAGIAEEKEFCQSAGEVFTPTLPAPGFDEVTGCDDTSLGWQLLIGYQLIKWIGIEGGYTELGGSDVRLVQTAVDTDVDGWTLGVAATAPYLEKIGLYIVGGAYYWDKDVQAQTPGRQGTKQNDSGVDAYFGGALRFPLTEKIGLNMEVKKFYDIGSAKVGKTDYLHFSAGLQFRF